MRKLSNWLGGKVTRGGNKSRGQLARRTTPIKSRRLGNGLEPLECRALMTATVAPAYEVTNSWNTGFQADLRLDNHQGASIAPWQLEFDMSANITSIWNAKVASHVGNHYTIVGESWDTTLPAGGSVDFGFVAAGSASAAPANYKINGAPLGSQTPPPPPTLSVGDAATVEGQSGVTYAVFSVALSVPATSSVTVKYATSDGTAQAGSDYRAAIGTLTFAAGETVKTITVQVLGDTQVESDETYALDLSTPTGATLARSHATGSITNDDVAVQNGNFQFQVSSDWGSGFTAQLTMRNTAATALNNWQVEFDFAGAITSIWDAKIVSHAGNHYVVQNAGYNSSIAAGGTQSFGFNGSRSSSSVVPTGYVLKGDAGSTGGGSGGSTGRSGGSTGGGARSTNHAPVAVNDFAFTSPGQSAVIDALANDTDPDGDLLSMLAVAQAAHGTAMLQTDGTIKYTPAAGFTGSDSFTYQVRDTQGATATGTVSINVAPTSTWPAHVYAPYVDMTLYPMYNLVSAAQTQGLRYFSLAFVVADANKKPSWGGYSEYELGTDYDAQLKSQIAGLRNLGGDVVVSFGGAAGQELAQAIGDVPTLVKAYQSVIDAYGLTHIDFDIEGAAVADHASIDRRNAAIAILQANAAAAGKSLDVSYTLPVLPSGLTADGLYVIQSAVRAGANVDVVNVMAMDYGDSAAPNPKGQMGNYAIAAANSVFTQLKSVYGASRTDQQLWQSIGVTPMIGLNDVTSETFDQQAARDLEAFAQQKGLGRIAIWSLNRDRQNSSGTIGYVDTQSSSLVQQPFEFSQIFSRFTAVDGG